MIRWAPAVASLLTMVGCQPLQIDQAAVDAATQRIEPRVVRDCTVLKVAGAVAAVAAVALPGAGIVHIVVDRACEDPEMTARAIALGEEAAKRVRAHR